MKLVFGVGYKDPGTKMQWVEEGRVVQCPYYHLWSSILRRSYSEVFHRDNPTYVGCTVSEEWHKFENFKAWVKSQPNLLLWLSNRREVHLDKDIIGDGNYNPQGCVFVPRAINGLFNDHGKDESVPLGVHFDNGSGKWKSQISKSGKREFLGRYESMQDAHSAWLTAKAKYIMLARKEYVLHGGNDRVATELKRRAAILMRLGIQGESVYNFGGDIWSR